MTDQQHSPRRPWKKKRDQRRGKTPHRMNIPPSPQWIEVKMADLPESCRFRLIYDANDVDVLRQGPVGLSHLIHLMSPLHPLPQPGWRQFGFTVFREEDIVVPDLGMLVSVRWHFALEWYQSRSAWDAFLFSLDHLQLKVLALPPTYIIPALFIVCMADRPDDSFLYTTLADWGLVLDETCQALTPLLQALYEYWIDGPSRAAFRYHQFVEYRPTEGADYWQSIDHLSNIIGLQNLEVIQFSEHLEATIMRQLLQVSMRLWAEEDLPFSKQDLGTLLSRYNLSALLSLALWSPSFSVKLEGGMTPLRSIDDVLHLWKYHMGIA